jgi:hypothetical protein
LETAQLGPTWACSSVASPREIHGWATTWNLLYAAPFGVFMFSAFFSLFILFFPFNFLKVQKFENKI